MATENEQSMPQCVLDALKRMGYEPDMTMRATIEGWWSWYTAQDSWYDSTQDLEGHKVKTQRLTLHPARRVCEEWASTILDDDDTKVGTDVDTVSDQLNEWVKTTGFIPMAQKALGRAFGVGTGALALWFRDAGDNTVVVRARRYDARMILPLSWDDDGVTDCAFVTRAYINGKPVHQLQIHTMDQQTGTYWVRTRLFDGKEGHEVRTDRVIDDFDTGSPFPTFAILRPAIDNVYAEGTYMGQSVFADAIDTIKGVDGAWDSLVREIDATKVKVFMSDELFRMQEDETGKKRAVPMSPENTIIRKLSDVPGMSHMYEVYSPKIRAAELIDALNAALSQLGSITGFGPDYFRFDRSGGIRTATEVVSGNSGFMRAVRKHENELRPQLEGLLRSVLACQSKLNGWAVPKGVTVTVDFDDSVIEDTPSEKRQMLNEVAAGVVPKWMYLVRFYAMGEDEAREAAADPTVLDLGA